MRSTAQMVISFAIVGGAAWAADPNGASVIAKPDAFTTLVNPACSHCRDEAARRAGELKSDDRVLCWIRGYSDGGAAPSRFFLAPYRVISDSYGVFVYDPEAGYTCGFAPSYDFRFFGWRDGVMAMRRKDGTLFSCLTGVAFEGPRKGDRLRPVPTLVSDWGNWLARYPNAVAYHMLDKYKPVELPVVANPGSVKSRGAPDPRLAANEQVPGVRSGREARAYPTAALEHDGLIAEEFDGGRLVVLWEPKTRSAAAYRLVASQPRKYRAPKPDASGVSPPDAGEPVPPGDPVVPSRSVALAKALGAPGHFRDSDTNSLWDVAGRCVEGDLKGWTLEWVDGVQVKWFAWAAEHPETSIFRVKE